MNIETWLQNNVPLIQSHSPQLDAELLLADRLGKNRSHIIAFADEILPAALLIRLQEDVEKLQKGYPLAYLLGRKSFWDMELLVGEETLIPRPDTEILIEVAQTIFSEKTTANIIDLGTGSGALAIALSRVFPLSQITATDTKSETIAIARKNATRWQKALINFTKAHWLNGFSEMQFDLIVSNPPYISENDEHLQNLRYEPLSALVSSNEGLADIETIIQQSEVCLKPDGWLLLEHGFNQGQAMRDILTHSCWQEIKTYRDLGGNERITAAQIIRGQNVSNRQGNMA